MDSINVSIIRPKVVYTTLSLLALMIVAFNHQVFKPITLTGVANVECSVVSSCVKVIVKDPHMFVGRYHLPVASKLDVCIRVYEIVE